MGILPRTNRTNYKFIACCYVYLYVLVDRLVQSLGFIYFQWVCLMLSAYKCYYCSDHFVFASVSGTLILKFVFIDRLQQL